MGFSHSLLVFDCNGTSLALRNMTQNVRPCESFLLFFCVEKLVCSWNIVDATCFNTHKHDTKHNNLLVFGVGSQLFSC